MAKFKLIPADYIFICGLLLMIVAHTTTNFLIAYYGDVAQEVKVAEEVALMYEANPVARWAFGIAGIKEMFGYIIAPSIIIGLWVMLRRQYQDDRMVLEAYAIAIFCFFLLDALNDVSILLGTFL